MDSVVKRKKNPRKPRKMHREYGIGSFLDWSNGGRDLADAARKVQKEEQMLRDYEPPAGSKPH